MKEILLALQLLCPKADAQSIAPILAAESARVGIDPVIMVSMMFHESSCDRKAVGKKGEVGWFQIKPGTMAAQGVPARKLRNGKINARLAADHILLCLTACGSLTAALGKYNGRPHCPGFNSYATKILQTPHKVRLRIGLQQRS